MTGQTTDCDALKNNDPQAIERLFRSCYSYVTGFLVYREKVSEEEASDACTDAVLLFAQLVRNGRADCRNPRAFILKTALNTIRQARRSSNKLQLDLMGDAFMEVFSGKTTLTGHDPIAEADEQGLLNEQVLSFERAWQKISERCRDILTKKVYEGWKNADLAVLFELKNNDVVVQAIAQCKESLKKVLSHRYSFFIVFSLYWY